MLADPDSGLATCSDLPSCSEVLCPVRRAAPPTLRQHYYPEGGWGWLVVAVAVAVQILTHGLHMAVGVFMPEAQKHFHVSQMATAQRCWWAGAGGSVGIGGMFEGPVSWHVWLFVFYTFTFLLVYMLLDFVFCIVHELVVIKQGRGRHQLNLTRRARPEDDSGPQ